MPYSYTSYFKLFFELSTKKYAVIANFFVILQLKQKGDENHESANRKHQ